MQDRDGIIETIEDEVLADPLATRILRWIGRVALAIFAVAVVLVGGLLLLDTERGRVWLADRIEALEPRSGLRIGIDSIDGSLFDAFVVTGLTLDDPRGRFLEAPRIAVDWRPRAIARNRLHIVRLDAPQVRLLRLPKLLPPEEDAPILPDYDIYVGRATIGELVLEPPVLGRRQVLGGEASADIASGRLLASLRARSPTGGDALTVRVDARPDDDRFALDGRLSAPPGGVIASWLKLDRPLRAMVGGNGSWQRWAGAVTARYGDDPLADLALIANAGRFTVKGTAAPGLVIGGLVRRLGGRDVAIDAAATIAERRVDGSIDLRSPSIVIAATGIVDLAESRYKGVEIAARLLDPSALIRTLSGDDMTLALALDGSIGAARVDYRFDADWLALATTRLERVVAEGEGALPRRELRFPITLTVARLTGVGEFVEELATGVRLAGALTIEGRNIIGRRMAFKTDRLTAVADVLVDTSNGRYDVDARGTVPRYTIDGFGVVDVDAALNFVPEPSNPRQLRIRGSVDARVTRLDNKFLAWLFAGRPQMSARIDRTPDGTVAFADAVLRSPDMRVSGRGRYALGQRIAFAGRAQSIRFGGFDVTLGGVIARPEATVLLDSYSAGITLNAVRARFVPQPYGYAFDATADSVAGDVSGDGRIVTDAGETLFDIAAVRFAGMTASGRLRPVDGTSAAAGTLGVSGPGISGTVRLSPEGTVQRFDARLAARSGRLAIPALVGIRRGTLDGTLVLAADGADISGGFDVEGVTSGQLFVKTAKGTLEMKRGEGSTILIAAGERGAPFTLDMAASFDPERVVVTSNGSIAKQPFALRGPAVLTRHSGGWRLTPVVLALPKGSARLGGNFGPTTEVGADLDGAGLELFELFAPGIGLDGEASGIVDMTFARGRLPRGEAKLRVRDFTRVTGGIATPVDMAIVVRLEADRAVMRAAFHRSGERFGTFQARLAEIPGGIDDPWIERIARAPLSAQLRWRGPSEMLWPLTGVSAISMRGRIAVAVDMAGVVGDPALSGLVRARGARVESAITGTAVDNIVLDGRFNGSRLDLTQFSGVAGKGSVSGSGIIDLSLERGFPIDASLQLDDADLLNREDLRATASGPLRIRNGPDGALISGELEIDKARFRIGRPGAAEVPTLKVRETNVDLVRTQSATAITEPTIWRFDVKARGNKRIDVRGMGLDSEWSADLDIQGSANAPRLSGTAKLVRGDYEFAGRRFKLTRGELRFGGSYPPDPVVDIAAEARVDGLTATITIRGTGQRPEIAFNSIPALPQDEVLSRVLFGTSIANLSAPEALQLAGAVASLRGGNGLNPIDSVRRAVGLDRLRVLQSNSATGQRTAVAAGEYITDRVYVEVATDAQGYTATQLEVELTRALSILSSVATLGGTSINLKWSKDY
jgi:translocation and assembly module TamB